MKLKIFFLDASSLTDTNQNVCSEKLVMLNDMIKTSEMHFGGGAEKWREINSADECKCLPLDEGNCDH